MKKSVNQAGMGSATVQKGIKFGITPKMLLGILVPLFVVLLVMGLFLSNQISGTVDQVMSDQLDASALAAAGQVDAFFERYFGIAEGVAGSQLVRDMVMEDTEGDITTSVGYQELLNTMSQLRQDNQSNVDCIWLCKFKTGETLQYDTRLYSAQELDYSTREWYSAVMEKQGSAVSGAYESANNNGLMVTVASPVFVNGQIQGIVGIDLSLNMLSQTLSEVKVGNTGYITLYDSNGLILYTPDSALINTNLADAGYSSDMLSVLESGENHDAMPYTVNGTPYYGSSTVIDAIGYTMLGTLPQAEFASYTNSVIRILVAGIVVCAVLLAAICAVIALSITRPLKRLNVAVGQLADGELDVTVDARGRDEVSELGGNVARIVERLKEYIDYIDEVSSVLGQIGQGNLSFALRQAYVGEFARLKDALLNIQSALTETITSIARSAEQVNAGADQIATGAQALAQGATEQASSVEELSSSIQDLSSQATDEADQAVEAGKFLSNIQDEVEKSNQQMEMVRHAMADISTQSNAIRGIIKTIDDIAFQTNILALNAAVEAARAGSAGKGFAVVADEVRSLASKSAEAAKRTNELIENSIQAVQRGEELTQTAADSLAVVADGTHQIVSTIHTVAETYRAQAHQLGEIANGVNQISSVVQTNSATAEESAAASEELSGQAAMMRQQIAHFQLEDSVGNDHHTAPAVFDKPEHEAMGDSGKY